MKLQHALQIYSACFDVMQQQTRCSGKFNCVFVGR